MPPPAPRKSVRDAVPPEKRPTVAMTKAPAPARRTATSRPATAGARDRGTRPPPRRVGALVWIGVAAGVLVLGGVAWLLLGTPPQPTQTKVVAAEPKPTPLPPSPPAAPAAVTAVAKPVTVAAAIPEPATVAAAAVEVPPPPAAKPVAVAKPAPPKDDTEPSDSNRYGKYMHRAGRGPHASVVVATTFGTAGYEEFVDAGALADGTIVAFGNAWGPQFPSTPKPIVLGKGKHLGLSPTTTVKDKKGAEKQVLSQDDPDAAGMIVCYDPALTGVRKVIRFDWGVATITAGLITRDGKDLIIAGRATAAFRALHAKAPIHQIETGAKAGGYEYAGTACTGDIYVMRLGPDGTPQWAWILEAMGKPPEQFWTDAKGAVYFDSAGLKRIGSDGRTLAMISDRTAGKTAKWLAVDPKEGTGFYGGDRNTFTNRQPYRQPYLYKYDGKGSKLWTLWEPDPKKLGSDTPLSLESDSSPRAMDFAPNGDLLVGGWSDGGNSVFPKQATDMTKPATSAGYGMSPWGMKNANSLSHLIRIDPKTLETKAHSWWVCYLPGKNAPNHASIRSLKVMPSGLVAFTGNAATGLIQTPNAFFPPFDETSTLYGGEFVTVFNEDFTHLAFSSYMPGCENLTLGATSDGVLVVSRAKADDGRIPATASPAHKPLHGFGGATDAHIVLLRKP